MVRHLKFFPLVAVLVIAGVGSAGAQNPPAPIPPEKELDSQLSGLVKRVLDHADLAGCRQKNCTILVANFVDPSGSTSLLGMQLADAVAAQLAVQAKGIQLVERSRLQDFLGHERIPSKLLVDNRAMAWLASTLSASAVLIGYLEIEKTGVYLSIQLQNARSAAEKKRKVSFIEKTVLTVQNSDRFLAPTEPFGAVPHAEASPQGEKIFRAGKDGISMPSCFYRPDPSYSDGGRAARFQGTIMLEVTISAEARVEDIQMVRGVPFGLNDEARKAVATWRCKPGSLNGTPVPTRVPIEITFRIGI